MKAILFIAVLIAAQGVLAQSNVYSVRVVGSTPYYERILIPRGHSLRPETLKGLDDLGAAVQFPETNRIDRLFADATRERTNNFLRSCLTEISLDALTLKGAGDLLSKDLVHELLRDTIAIPRSAWTNQVSNSYGRYVFSLVGSSNQTCVVDLRSDAFAVVYFPDHTYRCVVGTGYMFVDKLREQGIGKR